MRYLGILLLDVMLMLAAMFVSNWLNEKSAKEIIGVLIVGTALLYGWSVCVYIAISMIVRG